MTKEEKLLTVRNLWEDMRSDISTSSESPEIIDLLDQRSARIESGEAELLEWDKVKGSIGRHLEETKTLSVDSEQ
ncbi:addiction module protein [Coraliomargarita algicola]|uniref:Addiction module protein n=1 Tax=Coraliomargarita algicola TaxID=3092156 RepID=A0ABZ0RGJ5_9BACT|nr:addiction module protein [Coraliomargarita sp. J2-16]WPJ94223.1 addiction module protein [Coraliomargarita sp. J2-16]